MDFDKTLPVEMHDFCDAYPTIAAGFCVLLVQNEKVRLIGSKVKLSSPKHAQRVSQWKFFAKVMGARLGAAMRYFFKQGLPIHLIILLD